MKHRQETSPVLLLQAPYKRVEWEGMYHVTLWKVSDNFSLQINKLILEKGYPVGNAACLNIQNNSTATLLVEVLILTNSTSSKRSIV